MKVFLAALTAVLLALTIEHHVMPQRQLGIQKSETAYDRVIRTGTLRCGYTPYSIGFIKDPNTGKFDGIYYDIVTQLASHLGLKVEWVEEVGWGEQIEGLNARRYDMICSPVSLNAGRARAADFSIPLYDSPVHIWARKGNEAVGDDLKKLDAPSVRIATLDGEQTSVFATQFFPHAGQVSLPQSTPFSDLILQVTTGKADIVFAEPLPVLDFMKANPDALRRVTPLDKPLLVVPNILLLPRGEYELKEMVDNGLRDMFNAHQIDRVIDHYEPYPNSYVRETSH